MLDTEGTFLTLVVDVLMTQTSPSWVKYNLFTTLEVEINK